MENLCSRWYFSNTSRVRLIISYFLKSLTTTWEKFRLSHIFPEYYFLLCKESYTKTWHAITWSAYSEPINLLNTLLINLFIYRGKENWVESPNKWLHRRNHSEQSLKFNHFTWFIVSRHEISVLLSITPTNTIKNQYFYRAIWNKLAEWIFANFEITRFNHTVHCDLHCTVDGLIL